MPRDAPNLPNAFSISEGLAREQAQRWRKQKPNRSATINDADVSWLIQVGANPRLLIYDALGSKKPAGLRLTRLFIQHPDATLSALQFGRTRGTKRGRVGEIALGALSVVAGVAGQTGRTWTGKDVEKFLEDCCGKPGQWEAAVADAVKIAKRIGKTGPRKPG